MAVPVAAFAHQTAMIVRRFRFLSRPEIAELRQKNHNKEDAEESFAQASDHGIIVPNRRHHRAEDRNCAENLCHIKIRAALFPQKPLLPQSQTELVGRRWRISVLGRSSTFQGGIGQAPSPVGLGAPPNAILIRSP